MPVDPAPLSEWLTDAPTSGAAKLTLVTAEGLTVCGYQASLVAPGARNVVGYVPHWSSCPQAAAFRKRT